MGRDSVGCDGSDDCMGLLIAPPDETQGRQRTEDRPSFAQGYGGRGTEDSEVSFECCPPNKRRIKVLSWGCRLWVASCGLGIAG
jgi:hypothetical protein